MSAIAAIVDRDGGPIDRCDIEVVIGRSAPRGPDHLAVVSLGAAALGHALFQTVPEDRPGLQPFVDRAHDIALALDGRVDNRDELARLAGELRPDASDAELVARAFVVVGPAVFPTILGEFAIVVWDGLRRRLIAARDVFGLRPLLFREAGRRVMVASEMRALLPAAPVTLNKGRVAEWLAGTPTSLDESLYCQISRLKPGHRLTADPNGVRVERFISIDGQRRLTARGNGELEEQFRFLLDAATTARLRSSSGVGVMLSGGVDSTAVYTTVRAVAPDREVAAFTLTNPMDDSEAAIAADTAARHRGRSVRVTPDIASFDQYAVIDAHLEPPVSPGGANSARLRTTAAQQGCRVVLSGNGGDEWCAGTDWAAADLLRSLRLRALARFWRGRRTCADPISTSRFAQAALLPLVPPSIRSLARPVFPPEVPPWIRRDFMTSVSLRDRLRARPDVMAAGAARIAMLKEGLHGYNVHAIEDDERVSAWCGVEERMPFYDRRVVELALALPDDLLVAQPVPKQFLRTVLADRLPQVHRTRQRPVRYDFILRGALDALGGRRPFEAPVIEQLGFVDGRLLRQASDACHEGREFAGRPGADWTWALWSAAAVETWIRVVTQEPTRVASH